ncbi:MAG: hypothetical protein BMS9Abin15_0937 [Gammaproteobacteria bacterium]|nr:MAG: hypothetical protein BMS9Abin15_0937 [Gammaproteobacteria bacterium]
MLLTHHTIHKGCAPCSDRRHQSLVARPLLSTDFVDNFVHEYRVSTYY